MKDFSIALLLCMGALIEDGFSMMECDALSSDTTPSHTKIVSKGFKPPRQLQEEKFNSAKNQPSSQGQEVYPNYDKERGTYFYGENLTEAAKQQDAAKLPSSGTPNKDGIVSLK